MKIPKIERLPSGSYRCRITIDGHTESITDTTKEAVEKKAWAYRIGAEKIKACDGSLTLAEAISAYIESRKNTLSPSTIRGYKIIRNNQFESLMPRKLASLNPQLCQRAIDDQSRRYAPKTVANAWRLIHTVIKEYGGEDINVRLPQKIRADRPFLAPDQIPQFLEAINGTEIEIAALLALSSLRQSEILALTYGSVDYKNKSLSVSGAVVRDEFNQLVRKSQNKTFASARTVPIFIPRLFDLLSEARKKHKASDPIVTVTPRVIYGGVNRACRNAGLPAVGIHGLRHSFASLAYALDVPEMVAMRIGGWSDFATMRRIYTHIAEKQAKINVDKLASFFEKS
jgi:integrase